MYTVRNTTACILVMKVLFLDNLFARNLSRQDKILVNKLSTKGTFIIS